MSKKIRNKSKITWNQNKYDDKYYYKIIRKHKSLRKKSQKLNFERLEIIAVLNTPFVVYDSLHFDGLLTHKIKRYILGRAVCDSHLIEGINTNFTLPIKKVTGGIYLASKASYTVYHESVTRWRKKIDEHMAEKHAKAHKQIYSTRGKMKEYNKKLRTITTDRVSWIVIGDKKEIRKILNFCTGIGKKTSQGYGSVKHWLIRPTNQKGVRFFPSGKKTNMYKTFSVPYADVKKASYVINKTF